MASVADLMIANLRRLQRERRWTQEQMAEALGVEQSTISARLSGAKGWATVRALEEALEHAGIDPAEMVRPVDDVNVGADPEIMEIVRLLPRAPAWTRQAILTLVRGGQSNTTRVAESAPPPARRRRSRRG